MFGFIISVVSSSSCSNLSCSNIMFPPRALLSRLNVFLLFARKLCVRLKQHDNTLLIKASRHLAAYEMNMGEFIEQCHKMRNWCVVCSSLNPQPINLEWENYFFLRFFVRQHRHKNVIKFIQVNVLRAFFHRFPCLIISEGIKP